ncbi:MAG TPA: metallopeptidase family protein [Candidatus Limnocylindrales bacterium]
MSASDAQREVAVPIRGRGRQARRSPARRVPLPDPFEASVQRALDGLPSDARRLLETVAIVIEQEPSPRQRRDEDLAPDETLYGLYEGTPITEYGADLVPFPNKITIFRGPLEDDFPDRAELEDEIRITVLHELAHHVGFGDRRLHDFGLD